MKLNYSFILFPTSTPGIKTIYEIQTLGNKVISRKSLGIRIQEKNWDKSKKRVKSKEPESIHINKILQEKEEQHTIEKDTLSNLASENCCSLKYMEMELERGRLDGTKKISTYNKYITVLNSLRKSVAEKMGTKYLPFSKLKNLDTIRQITLGLNTGYRRNGKPKNPKVIFNYLSVFKSFVDHWNRYSGTQYPVNTSTFFNFVRKTQPKKLAPVITSEQIHQLENYIPPKKRDRSYRPQILARNTFLFQYYAAGIRFIDAITLTNKMIKEDKLVIPIRKTSDFISAPFYYPMIHCMKDYFPEIYRSVIDEVKLGGLSLDANSIQQLFRLERLDFANLTHKDLCEVILRVAEEQSERELTRQLKQIKNRLEGEIISVFFQRLRALPERFIFPHLDFCDFRDSLENQTSFSKDQEYFIHRARTRHNGSLKRISENLGIEGLTGHVPRHTLANHLAYSGHSEEEIRQVLGHSNIKTTKIYLRERHGFSGSHEIMKRFLEGKV
ncbi:tyrosine-type recombinase/integrase [Mariniradius sediminis]|uniref:Tyrosine-type recombinase/integrase n=1 Tax=Mariniradius sediminis TaxID=2909237 RepID=A0ABS9BVL2_9BACT|nr:tyrosine-type recombinase/integrase [Mariniradius sediminis]MCF1751385.1 tyrosine-type recombinase/integrase [Mariniradius sediminis]